MAKWIESELIKKGRGILLGFFLGVVDESWHESWPTWHATPMEMRLFFVLLLLFPSFRLLWETWRDHVICMSDILGWFRLNIRWSSLCNYWVFLSTWNQRNRILRDSQGLSTDSLTLLYVVEEDSWAFQKIRKDSCDDTLGFLDSREAFVMICDCESLQLILVSAFFGGCLPIFKAM